MRPKVAQVKRLTVNIPFEKSIAYKLRRRWVADLGLYNSRRFKVGFGAKTAIIVPGTKNSAIHDVESKLHYILF